MDLPTKKAAFGKTVCATREQKKHIHVIIACWRRRPYIRVTLVMPFALGAAAAAAAAAVTVAVGAAVVRYMLDSQPTLHGDPVAKGGNSR